MLKKTFAALVLGSMVFAGQAAAADYVIDREGQHAFVNFKASHLGYSWLWGTFKDFEGSFSFDAAQPEASKVKVTLKTASLDSNHAERDKHLRSKDFFHVDEYPEATFRSTRVEIGDDGDEADVTGELTLRGVTREVTLDVELHGYGDDPWGGYRMGFDAETEISMKDFGFPTDLGPATDKVKLEISVEGVRQ